MATQTISQAATAPSPRVDARVLGRLAERVAVAGERPALAVENSMSGERLGEVPHCTRDDVAVAARRARAVQAGWAARPVGERAAVLLRLHDLVLERQDEVLDLIQLENGKARRHAFEEVLDVALTARYYAHTAAEYLRPKRRQGVQLALTEVWEHHHPKGLVGVISPWNYPLTLGISDALPALVAGNAVLAKPDERTPFSALWAVALLEEAGMPPGLVQVVTGHRPGRRAGRAADRPVRLPDVHRQHARGADRRGAGRRAPDRLLHGARRQERAARAR
jgi:succinate-semialdehyde dehydrogenase/glutarate-semialdehyde dehydrogenase